ncbi:MAG TPA: hypothetical protein VF950_11430 [Planctomycetota bacterium]
MSDEIRVQDWLDGGEDDLDPAALADQLQVDQRLRVLLKEDVDLSPAVLREIRFELEGSDFAGRVVGRLKPRSLRWVPLAAAVGLFAFIGWLIYDPLPAGPSGRALLVVGRLPLEAGDRAVKERLEKLGFGVVPKLAADAREAPDWALVAVSSTVLAEDLMEVAAQIRTRFRGIAVPVLVWEPRLYDEFDMIAGSVYGQDWGTRPTGRVRIDVPGHPLAAGLSGTVDVGPAPLSFGRAAGAVATIDGDPDRAALFAYEAGAPMPGGSKAPARRVGIFLFNATAAGLTDAGGRLFDAAVRWCVNR